ncbi:gastric triacylglycerol lipase-like isoform X3 [Phymastichus coffea]|uniref:gastric triacylglycerol lipase-like isoform X3 n=1 Tax=Phymastichus coffea TaxID=108790 RepID=UPI00273AF475|nr:gastric triacylglycerol lipase-like isoform X3 [Phymastichus coffea]
MSSTIRFPITIIFQLLICITSAYEGPIAGGKSIQDCIYGDKSKLPYADTTPNDVIIKEGYTAENHVVLTDDGYLLTLNRIPGPPNAPPVLLHHGFSATALDWVVAGKHKSLAFLLANKGYDVWMANARGGLYSSCHVKYTTSDHGFWNFSFNEIGLYDIPAEISYILKHQNSSLFYIGHSMGTTAFYVMATERPDITSKITLMFSFAPIAFLNHIALPLRITAFLSTSTITFVDRFSSGELYSPANKIKNHYLQILTSRRFQKYDYGFEKNLEVYHSPEPPEYDLRKVRVPIGLFWSENDLISTAEDVRHIHDLLPLTILYHKVQYPNFNHLDYLFAINAPEVVYSVLFDKMDIYR